MTDDEIDALANAWIAFTKTLDPETGDVDLETYKKMPIDEISVADTVVDLPIEDPYSAYKLVLKVLELSDDRWVIGNLAAGPLEALLFMHGRETLDKLETDIGCFPRLRPVIQQVWSGGLDRETNARLEVLRRRVQ